MQYRESYEQELDFKVLCFRIMKKWRTIFLIMICMAILMGGGRLIGELKGLNEYDPKVAEQEYKEALLLYQEQFDSGKQQIKELRSQLGKKRKYLQESIKMQINAYEEYASEMDVTVILDKNNSNVARSGYTESILNMYSSYVSGEEALNKIGEVLKIDLEPQYLQELITVTVNKSAGSMTIKTIYTDINNTKLIMDSLLQTIKNCEPFIKSDMGAHEVQYSNVSSFTMVDTALDTYQKSVNDSVINMQHILTSKNTEFEALEKPNVPVALSYFSVITNIIKYAVSGLAIGFILAFFLVAIGIIMSDRIYDEKTLRCRYGLKSLGELEIKKDIENKIDVFVKRLERGKESSLYDVVSKEIIAVKIAGFISEEKKILLIGPTTSAMLRQVAISLKNGFEKQNINIQVETAEGVFVNPVSLHMLKNCSSIILVGEKEKTSYHEIENLIQLLQDLKKEIIGIILLV